MPRHQLFVFLLLITTALLSACGPGKLPSQKIGKPYVINGESYYPAYDSTYDKTGTASWYGPGFHGKYTASGEVYDQNDYTAAHPTLPMPSLVRVTNLENGKSNIVRVNDRGPFTGNRLIDLSKKSARSLGIHGLAQVRVQFLERETQDYITMVKANGGTIIPMEEYYRSAAISSKQPQLAQNEEPLADEDAVAAPTMTVAQDDINSQRPAPVNFVSKSEPVVEMKTPEPRLFVSEAMAEEAPIGTPVEAPQATLTVHANQTILDAAPAAGNNAAAQYVPEKTVTQMAPVNGKYTIQAGAFSSEQNARKLEARLQSIGDTFVDPIVSRGRTLWRVQVGGFIAPDYAEEVLAQVRQYVPDAKITRR